MSQNPTWCWNMQRLCRHFEEPGHECHDVCMPKAQAMMRALAAEIAARDYDREQAREAAE